MFKNGFFGPMNAKTQEGMGMSDLPKNIQVIFDNNPMLKELIPNQFWPQDHLLSLLLMIN